MANDTIEVEAVCDNPKCEGPDPHQAHPYDLFKYSEFQEFTKGA